MLPADQNVGMFHIEARLLDGVSPADYTRVATSLVNARYKTHTEIVKVEPILDAEEEIIGYTAFAAK
jgi:hypothetical protein